MFLSSLNKEVNNADSSLSVTPPDPEEIMGSDSGLMVWLGKERGGDGDGGDV